MPQVWSIRLTHPGSEKNIIVTEVIIVAADAAEYEEVLNDFLGLDDESWEIEISERPRPANGSENEQYERRGGFAVFDPAPFS